MGYSGNVEDQNVQGKETKDNRASEVSEKKKKKGFCWEVAEWPLALHLSKTLAEFWFYPEILNEAQFKINAPIIFGGRNSKPNLEHGSQAVAWLRLIVFNQIHIKTAEPKQSRKMQPQKYAVCPRKACGHLKLQTK